MIKLIALVALMTSFQAAATGGTYCTADTADVNVQLNLVNGRYYGSPIVPNSSVVVTFKGNNAEVLKTKTVTYKKTYEKNELYSWFHHENEMRLLTVKDVDAKDETAEVLLVVKLNTDWEKEVQIGTFTLELMHRSAQKRMWTGEIACDFE